MKKNIPKYIHIIDDMIKKIESGYFAANNLLPSESDLCISYDVSRITIRKAIEELAKKGYLKTQKGKGSFVNTNIYKDLNYIYSYTEMIKSQGKIPSRKLLSFSVLSPSESLRTDLLLDNDKKVYTLEILYYANDVPFAYSIVNLNAALFNNLDYFNFNEKSLYEILRDFYKIDIIKADYSLDSIVPNNKVSELLKINENIPVLEIDALSYCNINGSSYVPFEKYKSYLRTDIIKYIIKKNNN